MRSARPVTSISVLLLLSVLGIMGTGCRKADQATATPPSETTPSDAVVPAKAATPTTPASTRKSSVPSGDRWASAGRSMPGPTERTVEVPAGTVIKGELQTSLNSKTTQAGDAFSMRVSEPVVVDGLTVIPAGMVVHGAVKAVEPAGRASQKASMTLVFDSITLPGGRTVALGMNQYVEGQGDAEVQGESKKLRNTALIAGGAAAGALAGKMLGKDTKSTMIGAAAGGTAGTAAALALKGGEVDLKAGTPLTITLDHHLHVPVRVAGGSNVATP